MKAMRYHDYGGPEVMKYEDAPTPAPKDGRNPGAGARDGRESSRLEDSRRPCAPAHQYSVAGIARRRYFRRRRAGGRGAAGFHSRAMPVFAMIGLRRRLLPSMSAIKPGDWPSRSQKSMSHIQAASVPLAALTAWQALSEKGGLNCRTDDSGARGRRRRRQFRGAIRAARPGPRWQGTCSRGNNDFVMSSGLAPAVDYHTDYFPAHRRPVRCRARFDWWRVGSSPLELLKPGGVLVGVAPPSKDRGAAGDGGRAPRGGAAGEARRRALAKIGALIAAGKVRTTVAQVFPLAEAGKAHDLIKLNHTRGKIVLRGA